LTGSGQEEWCTDAGQAGPARHGQIVMRGSLGRSPARTRRHSNLPIRFTRQPDQPTEERSSIDSIPKTDPIVSGQTVITAAAGVREQSEEPWEFSTNF
jgi:hypothetical protein